MLKFAFCYAVTQFNCSNESIKCIRKMSSSFECNTNVAACHFQLSWANEASHRTVPVAKDLWRRSRSLWSLFDKAESLRSLFIFIAYTLNFGPALFLYSQYVFHWEINKWVLRDESQQLYLHDPIFPQAVLISQPFHFSHCSHRCISHQHLCLWGKMQIVLSIGFKKSRTTFKVWN